MKKIVCTTLAALILLSALLFCACQVDDMASAAKNADKYVIVAGYDDTSHVLSVAETVTLTNRTENALKEIKFHVYANDYRQDAKTAVVPGLYRAAAYPNGDSYGSASIEKVSANGKSVAFSLGGDEDILIVPLETELFPGEQITIEVDCEIVLANVKHRLGYTQNTVNVGNWFPVLCQTENGNYKETPYYTFGDPFVTDVANFDVTFIAPKGYVVASSGTLAEVTSDGKTDTHRFFADAVRDFAIVASTKYTKISQTQNGVQVNYFYFADENAEATLKLACDALDYFSKNVSPYPYAQYSVCETDFCYGGMEYPCLSMVASGSASLDKAVVHETAHQWFYGIVGNDQIENPWMDEGLADFLTADFFDNAGIKSLGEQMSACAKTYTTYVDVLNRYYDNVDTSFKSLDTFKSDSEYVILTYVKGSLLFNTMYETTSKIKFYKALSNYCKKYAFKTATPQNLADCFASVCGKEVGNVFTAFRQGKEIIGKVTDGKRP